MEAECEEVWRGWASGVKVPDLVIAFANNVIIANDDTGNGRKEDRVGRQVGREIVRGGEEVPDIRKSVAMLVVEKCSMEGLPGAHGKTNSCADVSTSSYIEISW